MASDVVCDGDNVVLDVNGERQAFVKLKSDSNIRVGKHSVPAKLVIGAPFGALFEVTSDGTGLQRVTELPDDGITRVTDTEKDNSKLFDNNEENQKLSHDEIEALKRAGKGGAEIIEALCTNSTTFQNKTEFAQDKYKRRKTKKYITYVTVRRPSARAICEAHYEKHADRIWNLRHDTLATMMALANVCAGAKVLVVESCMGVVTAAAVERMGGYGHVCGAQLDRPASLDAVRLMNLTEAERGTLFTTQLTTLLQAKEEAAAAAAADAAQAATSTRSAAQPEEAPGGGPSQPAEAAQAGAAAEPAAAPTPAEDAMDVEAGRPPVDGQGDEEEDAVADGATPSTSGAGGQGPRGPGSFHAVSPERLRMLASSGFSSCIVAFPKGHPTAVLDVLWPLLAPSATFVVYSPWVQPLAECFSHLQSSRCAVMLQLHESWLRPYQVLPSRTHPQMTCSGTGGYVLSGIKVVTANGKPLAAQLEGVDAAGQPPAAANGNGNGQGGRHSGGRGRGGGNPGGRGGRGFANNHSNNKHDRSSGGAAGSPAAKRQRGGS